MLNTYVCYKFLEVPLLMDEKVIWDQESNRYGYNVVNFSMIYV